MIVRLENRRAREVLRVGFFQYRALPDGKVDEEHYREIMEAIPEAAFGSFATSQPPPGTIDAKQKFAQRRLEHLSRWKPTQKDLATLRAVLKRVPNGTPCGRPGFRVVACPHLRRSTRRSAECTKPVSRAGSTISR